MSRNIADELVASMEQAVDMMQGKKKAGHVWTPADIDVKSIRQKRELSQAAFARRYGFSVGAVRDWEQRRRRPEKAARTLLLLIQRESEAVERVLNAIPNIGRHHSSL